VARCKTQSLGGSPAEVFDAALDAAGQLGFQVSLAERAAGHLFLSEPRGLRASPHRFGLSVIDSGIGPTVLHVSWDPHPALPWPWRSDNRTASCLCRCIQQRLGER